LPISEWQLPIWKDLFLFALPHGTRIRSLANFVGIVVGFLNVSIIRLRSAVTEPVEMPPRYPLNATWYNPISGAEGQTVSQKDIVWATGR
jgi:hypothetical protein